MLPRVQIDEENSSEVGRNTREIKEIQTDSTGRDAGFRHWELKAVEEEMDRRKEELKELDRQSRSIGRVLEEMEGMVEEITKEQSGPRRPTLPHTQLSRLPDPDTSDLTLVLLDFPSLPLYVKRRFDIHFQLVNRSGQVQTRHDKITFRLSVHKMTDRGEEIKRTRAGTSILQGSLVKTFHPHQQLTLQNVRFKDISWHFPHGRVNMMIRSTSHMDIKPLFVEGIRVKSKKKTSEEAS